MIAGLLAQAEDLTDQPACRVERLDRNGGAGAGLFLDRPDLIDVVAAQVQVEAGIHHVLPRPHRFQRLHRAGMDLDAAAIADKDHHRDPGLGQPGQHGIHSIRIQRAHEGGPGDAVGAEAVHLHLRDQPQELVRVGHAPPFGAQHLGLVGAGPRGLGGLARREREPRPLIAERARAAQPLPRAVMRALAQDDLVHRVARRIEHLKAAARAGLSCGLDHEGMAPMRRENAQVDRLGQDHRGVLAGVIIRVIADLLVHAGGVARERHDLAEGLRRLHHAVGMRRDARGPLAAGRRHERRLGNAQCIGLIAGAHPGIVRAKGADRFGIRGCCRGLCLCHTCLMLMSKGLAASGVGGCGCDGRSATADTIPDEITRKAVPNARTGRHDTRYS